MPINNTRGKMIFFPGMEDRKQSALKDSWQLKNFLMVGMINCACLANLDHLKPGQCKDYKFKLCVNMQKYTLSTFQDTPNWT